MHRTMTTLLYFMLILVTLGVAASARAGWNQSRTQTADTALSKIVTSATPSVAACVAIDGNIVYQKAFGTIMAGVPATPQTIYRVGSLSKQFTAAAILALIEDGTVVPADGSQFGLASNVSLFFTGVGQWSQPGSPPMTVKRLLNMTSNLPAYTAVSMPGLVPTQPVQASALLKGILTFTPTSTAPAYNYSNTNYFLLASIIDVLTDTNAKFRNKQRARRSST